MKRLLRWWPLVWRSTYEAERAANDRAAEMMRNANRQAIATYWQNEALKRRIETLEKEVNQWP